jgi:NAD+-dependent protein deacetylase sirtuin 2
MGLVWPDFLCMEQHASALTAGCASLQELYPGNFRPTPAHHFIRLLHDKGLLVRCYTQNIDSLERLAGVPADKVVAAHGNFDAARCIACHSEADLAAVEASIIAGEARRWLVL